MEINRSRDCRAMRFAVPRVRKKRLHKNLHIAGQRRANDHSGKESQLLNFESQVPCVDCKNMHVEEEP